MPFFKLMLNPKDVIYAYDGTIEGFYCCLYQSVYAREMPYDIKAEKSLNPHLFTTINISTNYNRAARVRSSIKTKISNDALEIAEAVFLSCLTNKEIHLMRFLLLGYEKGKDIINMQAHPHVHAVFKAYKHMLREAHLLKGFIRFSDYNGCLGAVITPKNFILPFLAEHFATRFPLESFLIYDKTHAHGLFYSKGNIKIIPIEDMAFNPHGEEEEKYKALWKRFYNTIAIEERANPKCRRNLCPKRYWANMVELEELL